MDEERYVGWCLLDSRSGPMPEPSCSVGSCLLWRIIGSGVAVLIDWQAAVYSDVAARAGGVD
jgi:hypothetical protein